jgi:glutamate/tyrosine decarboxylase-like PLP-dependent enzyme
MRDMHDSNNIRDLLFDAAARAVAYLAQVDERSVAPDFAAIAGLDALDTPVPEEPSDPAIPLAELDSHAGATAAMSGPRFFGFVRGGNLPAALAANWLAGAWDQNTVSATTTPLTAKVEAVALRWLVDLLGLPEGTGVGFVTGATMAHFSCLVAARHAVLEQVGWDVEGDGVFGAPPVTVIVGDETHPSVTKSLGLMGFGRNRLIRLPVDDQGRIWASAVPDISGPTILCLQAGNISTGAFDPAAEIIPLAKAAGAWVHVDGAFGLWAAASPQYRHLLAGFADADSWATDAHKYLSTPYDSGLAFVRNPQFLRSAMAITAAYLPASTTRDPADFTPELSRRARGVEVWAAIRSLGRSGIRELVERTCRHARRFAEGLQEAGYQVLNEVVLNQVLVAFGDAATTQRVIAGIQQDGTCWVGGTIWQGHTAIRISLTSWRTTDADVERSLAAMIRVAKRVRDQAP